MASRTITFRFPEDVIEAIEARARSTGTTRTAVLMQALAQAYGFPSLSPAPVSTAALQQQLQNLEQQVVHVLGNLADSIGGLNQTKTAAIKTDAAQANFDESATQFSGGFSLFTQVEQKAKMLDQIFASVPDLVFVQDRLGRFTYVNLAGARALGFEPSYFLGKTCLELGTQEDIGELFSAKCEIVFTTSRPISGEFSISALYATRNYEYILSPVYNGDGSIEAVVCNARDITERKLAEIALRKSEEEYRTLFEYANDSIFIIDASTNQILNANRNAARRLGYTLRELLQLSFTDLEAQIVDQELIKRELQKTGSVIYEHMLRRKDGTQIPVEISTRLIESRDYLALQSFVRDTARRQSQD